MSEKKVKHQLSINTFQQWQGQNQHVPVVARTVSTRSSGGKGSINTFQQWQGQYQHAPAVARTVQKGAEQLKLTKV